jgi:GT2 family glycosyltransferase
MSINDTGSMNVYSIVVTYNRARLLRRTLTELAENGFRRLIVVNNASTDETSEVLRAFEGHFEEFYALTLPANLGGAGGFAEGLRRFLAVSREGDYALLHDDDSWPNFAYGELAAQLGPSVRLGAFPVTHTDGTLVAMNRPGRARFLRSVWRAFEYFQSSHRPQEIEDFKRWREFEYCAFVGFLVRRDVVVAVGVPSPAFFIYSDDTVYTYLASRQYGPIVNLYRDRCTFIHDRNRATAKSLLNSPFVFYEVRNKIILFRLFSPWSAAFALFYVLRSLYLAPAQARVILKGALAAYREPLERFLPVDASAPVKASIGVLVEPG